METGLKISVLIPSWNGGKGIMNTIAKYKKQDYQNFNLILILGGEDTYIKKAKKIQWDKLTIIPQKVPNKLRSYNDALQDSSKIGDVIVFSDIDSEIPIDFLSKFALNYSNPKKNIVTGRCLPLQKTQNLVEVGYTKMWNKEHSQKGEIVNFIYGACYSMRKDFFYGKFHKFDETVQIGTDPAIVEQINALNEPIYFDKSILIYTDIFSENPKKFLLQKSRWYRILYLKSLQRNDKSKFLMGLNFIFSWSMILIIPLLLIINCLFVQNIYFFISLISFWTIIMVKSWVSSFLRMYCEKSDLKFLFKSFIFMLIKNIIVIVASIELMSKKHRYQWRI
ncbi:glycosyltransferase family 2 protein [Candidatus Lokiarchaeum ossiferum]|uniref:glycosyltransferase family 2 protein n=1 Tax=Candidatus Lokiarchaeum ossiferum TaxID=2951803 RepID=UPI00352DFD58